MKITIVGGGLVGSLASCIFGQKGHRVEVYELREDPNSAEGRLLRGRSINLALSTRGRATLARAGLEELVLSKAIPMKGRMLHSQDGGKKPVLYDPIGNQCIYSVSRRYLNEVLLSEASKLPNVDVHFNCKLLHADVDKGIAKFRQRDGTTADTEIEAESDLIIGADGAHSALRQAMQKRPMTNFSQKYIEHGYMELYIPPRSDGKYAMDKNFLHIWPRDRFMLIALPNLDGSFTVTLFMPFTIFQELKTSQKVESFFEREFPDAVPLIGKSNLSNDFLSSKPAPLISISCWPLNAAKGVLVGDAAHAMVPFYGQGMNAGFEDVLILDDVLGDVSDFGVEKSLEKFTSLRSADAMAICELAMYNYEEMRHLVNQKSFYLRRLIDITLHKLIGNSWVPLYTQVTFSRTPYTKCISHKKWQDQLLGKLKRMVFIAMCASSIAYFAYSKNLGTNFLNSGKDVLQKFVR